MDLSQDLQDYILLIAFNYLQTNIIFSESDNVSIRQINLNGNNNKKEWIIETDGVTIKIYVTYLPITTNTIKTIHVFKQVKLNDREYSYELVGDYLYETKIRFLRKIKESEPGKIIVETVIASEYEKYMNPAMKFAVGLFYALNPNLFTPKWKIIAKRVLGLY